MYSYSLSRPDVGFHFCDFEKFPRFLFLPIKRNRYQSEDTSCHSDVGYEVVDCAVDVSERPMAACQKSGKMFKKILFLAVDYRSNNLQ